MAQGRAIAAGEHRRHPSPFIADVRVSDGVDTAVYAE
jgi:hypothetical protein